MVYIRGKKKPLITDDKMSEVALRGIRILEKKKKPETGVQDFHQSKRSGEAIPET